MTSTIDDFEDTFDDLDEFDDDERGVSGFVVLLIILAMLLAFSFIVWLAYNKGIRQGVANRDVPYVAADPEPVKRAAADRANGSGGEPNREVYDQIDGRSAVRTEVLGQAPEQPISLDDKDPIASITAQALANDPANAAKEVAGSVVAAVPSTLSTENGASVRYESAQSDQLTSVIKNAVEESTTPNAPDIAPSRGATTVTKTAAVTPDPAGGTSATASNAAANAATVTAATQSNASTAIGTHVVQVGAFGSEAEADRVWAQLSSRFGAYLDGKSKDIERADLGARGVFYRLRVAGFDSKSAASDYCSGLKARNQDCLVKSR